MRNETDIQVPKKDKCKVKFIRYWEDGNYPYTVLLASEYVGMWSLEECRFGAFSTSGEVLAFIRSARPVSEVSE